MPNNTLQNSADAPYHFNPSILREYDIRGIVGDTLSEDDAYALGRAFGTFLKRRGGKTICIGYDGRESSPLLETALKDGLMACGLEIICVGLGPTPMLYFSVKALKADAGIMITGSHNPSDYNGFKMTLADGPVFGETIQEIGRIAASGDFENGTGSARAEDVQDRYVERLLDDLTTDREMTIAWDPGNGAAGEITRRLTAKLPGKHILIHDEIDGSFPNHHPDPTVDKNLIDLQKTVAEHHCDLGIAFDGDGDRIGVVDENGRVLRCDSLMTIYAKDVLDAHPGASIIGDVKCSQVMFDEITRLGGDAVIWKTGHSLIKSKMLELKAPLAGELSGHIFFADKYYGYDDALYCAIRLMNAMSDGGANLSSLTQHLPSLFNTPEVRFEVPEEEKFGIVPKILENMRANLPAGYQISDIDGIRLSCDHGWWLLRPSNTQNVLVARAESASAEGLEELKTMAQKSVAKAGNYTLEFP